MNKLIIASGSGVLSTLDLERMLAGLDVTVITRESIQSVQTHQTKLVSDFIGLESKPFPMYSTSGKQKAQWKTERAFYKRK